MRKTLTFTAKISQGFLCTVAVAYFVFAGNLVAMFMNNGVIIGYGTQFLRGFCISMPFLCMDFLAVGVFQAVGLGRYALVFAIMRKVVLEIPALYILNALFPLYGLAYAQLTAEVVLAATAVIVLIRLFRKLDRE